MKKKYLIYLGLIPIGFVVYRTARYYIERYGRTHTKAIAGETVEMQDPKYLLDMDNELKARYPIIHKINIAIGNPII